MKLKKKKKNLIRLDFIKKLTSELNLGAMRALVMWIFGGKDILVREKVQNTTSGICLASLKTRKESLMLSRVSKKEKNDMRSKKSWGSDIGGLGGHFNDVSSYSE